MRHAIFEGRDQISPWVDDKLTLANRNIGCFMVLPDGGAVIAEGLRIVSCGHPQWKPIYNQTTVPWWGDAPPTKPQPIPKECAVCGKRVGIED